MVCSSRLFQSTTVIGKKEKNLASTFGCRRTSGQDKRSLVSPGWLNFTKGWMITSWDIYQVVYYPVEHLWWRLRQNAHLKYPPFLLDWQLFSQWQCDKQQTQTACANHHPHPPRLGNSQHQSSHPDHPLALFRLLVLEPFTSASCHCLKLFFHVSWN